MALVPLGPANGRTAWLVEDAGRTLAVFRCEEGHHVTDAACPHGGGPLVDGEVTDGHIVECPWHFYRFDLRTGRCEHGMYTLRRYPVVDRDGELFAEVPDGRADRRVLRCWTANGSRPCAPNTWRSSSAG